MTVSGGDVTADVFSTSVEVFPNQLKPIPGRFGLLHVRGGVSGRFYALEFRSESSPRPWRCFLEGVDRNGADGVFSTSVEVFEHFGSWRDCCLLT